MKNTADPSPAEIHRPVALTYDGFSITLFGNDAEQCRWTAGTELSNPIKYNGGQGEYWFNGRAVVAGLLAAGELPIEPGLSLSWRRYDVNVT